MAPGLAGLALLLGGCSAPGITENPVDAPVGGAPVVSVCYAPGVADRAAEVEPVARKACAAAGVADARLQYWDTSHLLNECPLLKKSRISYRCLPAGTDGKGAPAPPAAEDGGAGTH